MQDRDTKGDVYEYLLSLIASAGENGQFRKKARAYIEAHSSHVT